LFQLARVAPGVRIEARLEKTMKSSEEDEETSVYEEDKSRRISRKRERESGRGCAAEEGVADDRGEWGG